jgi:exopolyphosphatase/guanosine-5'-triphosphate,3'-diphosphate pyrophosphatase
MMQPTLRLLLNNAIPLTDQATWAALDLGSNSFHLLLARRSGASFVVQERLKEKVQLLSGFAHGQIQADAQSRGLACLQRFAQRLRPLRPEQIRAVGTCALREAHNAQQFAAAAERVLGAPLEIIDGGYEARLIYGAVAHEVGAGKRLVIDIGGGSTELALGDGRHVQHAESINVGCVAFKDQFFAAGSMQTAGYTAARQAAVSALTQAPQAGTLRERLRNSESAAVFGTSGTIESVQMVLIANGWSSEVITRDALRRLESAIVDDRWVIEAGLPGLAPDRTDIFPAGVAILSACMDVLGIESCAYVDVSLLQGMICEAVVPEPEVDLKQDSVQQLSTRFNVDLAQAARVTRTAKRLYQQSAGWWTDNDEYMALLDWAANLHELGVHISARHYHRHGAYIVKHAELPGFSEHQQRILALLIRGHRRSMPGLAFRAFDPELAHQLLRLVALLRLAVILERSHNDDDSPAVTLSVDSDRLHLDCGPGWLDAHPLSHRELQVEIEQQASAGIHLVLANENGST